MCASWNLAPCMHVRTAAVLLWLVGMHMQLEGIQVLL